jgi:hypothetical protein
VNIQRLESGNFHRKNAFSNVLMSPIIAIKITEIAFLRLGLLPRPRISSRCRARHILPHTMESRLYMPLHHTVVPGGWGDSLLGGPPPGVIYTITTPLERNEALGPREIGEHKGCEGAGLLL